MIICVFLKLSSTKVQRMTLPPGKKKRYCPSSGKWGFMSVVTTIWYTARYLSPLLNRSCVMKASICLTSMTEENCTDILS